MVLHTDTQSLNFQGFSYLFDKLIVGIESGVNTWHCFKLDSRGNQDHPNQAQRLNA